MTTETDRQRLLQEARAAMVSYVERRPVALADHPPGDLHMRCGGAFVSIHHRGDLRGCIGHIEADRSLLRVVRECAVAACSADPRFPPVIAEELAGLEIEVSLLGPFEPVASPDEVEVGRHGLLLPQVATEWGWDRETFLAQTCHKAGLARDAWKQGAKVWRFEAEVFGEGSFNTMDTMDAQGKN
jgi:AmmeMemoRadiSam system protein A